MIVFHLAETAPRDAPLYGTLVLPFQKRRSSRQRARLTTGEEVALLLPRGTVLPGGAVLVGDGERRIRIVAAEESVSRVETSDLLLLARAAYHLGNRHVAVQLEPGRISYLHDHVLDAMVRGLGLTVTTARAPFEPESGAYSHGGHGHHGHDAHDQGAHDHHHSGANGHHDHDDHHHHEPHPRGPERS